MYIQNAKRIEGNKSDHGEIVYELLGAVAGGSQMHSLAEIILPPGTSSQRHYHPEAEESYYILSGSARMELDGECAQLGPGDSVAILPNQVHEISNDSDEDVILLAVCVPAWTPDNSVFPD